MTLLVPSGDYISPLENSRDVFFYQDAFQLLPLTAESLYFKESLYELNLLCSRRY